MERETVKRRMADFFRGPRATTPVLLVRALVVCLGLSGLGLVGYFVTTSGSTLSDAAPPIHPLRDPPPSRLPLLLLLRHGSPVRLAHATADRKHHPTRGRVRQRSRSGPSSGGHDQFARRVDDGGPRRQ